MTYITKPNYWNPGEVVTFIRKTVIYGYYDSKPDTWFVVRYADGGEATIHPSELVPA